MTPGEAREALPRRNERVCRGHARDAKAPKGRTSAVHRGQAADVPVDDELFDGDVVFSELLAAGLDSAGAAAGVLAGSPEVELVFEPAFDRLSVR